MTLPEELSTLEFAFMHLDQPISALHPAYQRYHQVKTLLYGPAPRDGVTIFGTWNTLTQEATPWDQSKPASN